MSRNLLVFRILYYYSHSPLKVIYNFENDLTRKNCDGYVKMMRRKHVVNKNNMGTLTLHLKGQHQCIMVYYY